MEKLPGGHGVMMDDVLAGMYGFFLIYVFREGGLKFLVL